MIRRTQYLTHTERQALNLCCQQTLKRRKARVKRILGFFLGKSLRAS